MVNFQSEYDFMLMWWVFFAGYRTLCTPGCLAPESFTRLSATTPSFYPVSFSNNHLTVNSTHFWTGFLKFFCGHVSFFGATSTPVLGFWWRLLWVSKPEVERTELVIKIFWSVLIFVHYFCKCLLSTCPWLVLQLFIRIICYWRYSVSHCPSGPGTCITQLSQSTQVSQFSSFALFSTNISFMNLSMTALCSYLFRVKSRSQGQDYRILDLDLVESTLW